MNLKNNVKKVNKFYFPISEENYAKVNQFNFIYLFIKEQIYQMNHAE